MQCQHQVPQHSDPRPTDDPHELRRSLPAGQVASLASWRLLIVENDIETAERLRTQFSVLCDEVEVVRDPLLALGLIQQAIEHGRAYNAMILDLDMPNLLGTQLVRQLGALCPPFVVNTHSMTGTLSFGLVSMQQTVELSAARLAPGIEEAQLALCVSHKFAPLNDLVAKLVHVVEIAQAGPLPIERLTQAIEDKHFQPTASARLVHAFAEATDNLKRQLWPLLQKLEVLLAEREAPDETPSVMRQQVQEALTHVRRLERESFSTQYADRETASRLHTVLTPVQALRAPLERDCQEQFSEEVADGIVEWRALQERFYLKLNALYESQHALNAGKLSLPLLLDEVGAQVGYEELVLENPADLGRFPLEDKEGVTEKLVRALLDVYGQLRRERPDGGWYFRASFVREDERLFEEPLVRAKLNEIGAGAYYSLSFSDNCGQEVPMQARLEPLLLLFADFQNRNLGRFHFAVDDTGYASLIVWLKASELSESLESQLARRQAKQPDGSRLVSSAAGELLVQEDLASDNALTLIGARKGDLHDGGVHQLLLFRASPAGKMPETLVGVGGRHIQARFAVDDWCQHRGGLLRPYGDRSASPELQKRARLTQINASSVRATIEEGKAYVDCASDSKHAPWISQALQNLGFSSQQIHWSDTSDFEFGPIGW